MMQKSFMTLSLGWKGSAGTNTSYYAVSVSDEEKRFITLTPGANVIKLFAAVIYKFSY